MTSPYDEPRKQGRSKKAEVGSKKADLGFQISQSKKHIPKCFQTLARQHSLLLAPRNLRSFFLLPSSFFLLPSSFFLLPSSFCLHTSAFILLPFLLDFCLSSGILLAILNSGLNTSACVDRR